MIKNKEIKEFPLLVLGLSSMFFYMAGIFFPKATHFGLSALVYLVGYIIYFFTMPLTWLIILSYVAYVNYKNY